MIKMKKSAALILAGVLACSAPMPVMASTDTEVTAELIFLLPIPRRQLILLCMPRILLTSKILQMTR